MKKYLNKNTIGWFLVLFLSISISYASSSGTLGDLFEFITFGGENGNTVTDVYRLDGENIKDNTVSSYEIKNGTIQTEDIGSNQITSLNIKDGSITNNDIATGTLTENLLDPELAGNLGQWEENGDNIYYNSGSVGIGTDTPSSELEVIGNITASGNIISDLPIANTHVATKEYVDNIALAADTSTDSLISGGMTCYYVYSTDVCSDGFFKAPGLYKLDGVDHNICCTNPIVEQKIDPSGKSLYATSYDGYHYMTTPSGCEDKTDNPLCMGNDFVIKKWIDAFYYCDDLVYDGYDDWKLPSYSLLETINPYYLNMRLGGLVSSNKYWTNDSSIYPFLYDDGWSFVYPYGSEFYFRCVRKYGDDILPEEIDPTLLNNYAICDIDHAYYLSHSPTGYETICHSNNCIFNNITYQGPVTNYCGYPTGANRGSCGCTCRDMGYRYYGTNYSECICSDSPSVNYGSYTLLDVCSAIYP